MDGGGVGGGEGERGEEGNGLNEEFEMPGTKCPNCDSSDLRWYVSKQSASDIQDGRLRMHDVSVIAYLACEECSETLKTVMEDKVNEMLNATGDR